MITLNRKGVIQISLKHQAVGQCFPYVNLPIITTANTLSVPQTNLLLSALAAALLLLLEQQLLRVLKSSPPTVQFFLSYKYSMNFSRC